MREPREPLPPREGGRTRESPQCDRYSTRNGTGGRREPMVPSSSRRTRIPIVMPTVLSVTMAIGSHKLSQQDAITKRMTAIEEMAGMDVLCSDKTSTLTLNKLTVDKNLIEVFADGVNQDIVQLYLWLQGHQS
ncbi:hypothetical protein HN873_035937 [Arachis hypogaea]